MLTEATVRALRERTETDVTAGCHVWWDATDQAGYAYASLRGRVYRVARLLWAAAHGQDVPEGLVLDHVYDRGCVTRRCVNPDHLEAVSPRVNVVRGIAADRERKGQERLPLEAEAGEAS